MSPFEQAQAESDLKAIEQQMQSLSRVDPTLILRLHKALKAALHENASLKVEIRSLKENLTALQGQNA